MVTATSHGELMLWSSGAFTYIADEGFVGVDTFTYRAYDGHSLGNIVTVELFVENVPPIAHDDFFDVQQDASLTGTVLTNDVDPDEDSLTAVLVEDVASGELDLESSGTFTYTPESEWTGTVTFKYKLSDGLAESNVATVTINVLGSPPVPPPPPTINTVFQINLNQSYGLPHSSVLTRGPAQGLIGNAFTTSAGYSVSVETDVEHGTLSVHSSGAFTYRPDDDFVGTDSFRFRVNDGRIGTVRLNVTNNKPATKADAYSVVHDNLLIVTPSKGLLRNDTDEDGDLLTTELVPGFDVQHGVLTLDKTGAFVYQPDPGFIGLDGFAYRVRDRESTP